MHNITKKLHMIMSEVGRIEKDKKNDFHGYKYASEQAIKEAIHPLLVKHRVLFSTQVTAHNREGEITTARLEYTFFDIDTGEAMNGEFYGTGQDKGDKGLYKAITGGIKYILTSTFLIPTGDDPENEKSQPAVKGKKTREEVEAGDAFANDTIID